MSYIIVGPRYRGKFDAKRAKELGIPQGPQRSALAKGEAITFEIREGNEVIQRTVKPEEVIGKSDTPGVCSSFICTCYPRFLPLHFFRLSSF